MAETTTITISGLKIQQKIIGVGKPIIMLHGWGANIDLLTPLAERLAPLGYKSYMIDLPGFGQSDDPPIAWSVYDYVSFVMNYVNHHQLNEFFLFGHSFGGRLGLILGTNHSDRILKMALADSAGIKPRKPLLPNLRLKTYQSIRDGLYTVGAESLADTLREKYNQRYGSTDFNNVAGVMRETFVKVVNEDLLEIATRIKTPTLLFWGDKDEDTPLSDGKLLEQTIPDAGLVVHAGAGHYSYLEKVAETARIMDYFFKND